MKRRIQPGITWGLLGAACVAALVIATRPGPSSLIRDSLRVWPAQQVGSEFLGWEGTDRQVGAWDCGISAAAMMLAASDGDTTHLASARAKALADARALSLLDVRALLSRGGLTATGLTTNLEGLAQVPLPAVAHLPGHFVLIDSIAGPSVFVRDPARGRLRFPAQDFASLWTGSLLVVFESGRDPTPPAPTSIARAGSAAFRP